MITHSTKETGQQNSAGLEMTGKWGGGGVGEGGGGWKKFEKERVGSIGWVFIK